MFYLQQITLMDNKMKIIIVVKFCHELTEHYMVWLIWCVNIRSQHIVYASLEAGGSY